MKRKLDHVDQGSEALALDVLVWLAGDEERLFPFLQASGLNPGTVRESAGDPAFLGAVLDHVMGDEASLIACADAIGVKPEKIATAWRRMQPPDFDHDL
ncbi:DUF3572 domain-containing protein [Methylobacterium gnaphalii]|uniref:DUF3572 domain-containing protein n=1 Tax=Methylobacterium gnaphalii TaxID=1010610 RepID=A0A512JM56_9HYPH|nr:DUF3572 domain-containing protein [Methylobacterium gnaphalii]GEP11040.1 hypothetical protein MGN01_28850 [Methylobacterium gnaphalii]GJD69620.1 hypothetical protein MMMDOFMJ_2557 [Methylobacterium gnaphalii]GLS50318.1 hypothetical protein GCM10007885_31700 [Methylobacterium gnaphalii]